MHTTPIHARRRKDTLFRSVTRAMACIIWLAAIVAVIGVASSVAAAQASPQASVQAQTPGPLDYARLAKPKDNGPEDRAPGAGNAKDPDALSKEELKRQERLAELAQLVIDMRRDITSVRMDDLNAAIRDMRILVPDEKDVLREVLIGRARLAGLLEHARDLPAYWTVAVAAQSEVGDDRALLALQREGGAILAEKQQFAAAADMLRSAQRTAATKQNDLDLIARLRIELDEISADARVTDWRRTEFRFEDIRRKISSFPMWSFPNLLVTLREAVIRVESEPDSPAKYQNIGSLYSEATVIIQALDHKMTDDWRAEYREAGLIIEDEGPERPRPYALGRHR